MLISLIVSLFSNISVLFFFLSRKEHAKKDKNQVSFLGKMGQMDVREMTDSTLVLIVVDLMVIIKKLIIFVALFIYIW